MADYLHEDALVEILIRATIKTLLRCSSVCKSWHSIITNPSFMQAHLKHQKTTRDILIICTCTKHSQKEVYSCRSDDLAFTEVGCYSPYDHPYNPYFRIIDSCNGVLCLIDDHLTYWEDTFLWNPAIRVWIKLPPHPAIRNMCPEFDISTIFGVDPVTDDFVVIRIVYQKKGRKVSPKVLKYSLCSNTWENVSHLASGFRHLRARSQKRQVYYNGASHWVVSDKKKCCLAILLFHFGEDIFCSMDLPADVAFTNLCVNFRLAIFQGVLSVVETKLLAMKCSLWTMEQYGVESSWVKRFDINMSGLFDMVIGFRKDGRFLVNKKGKLCSYNPEKIDGSEEQHKYLGIDSRFGSYYKYSLHVVEYVKSLGLLGRQTDIWEDQDGYFAPSSLPPSSLSDN